MLTFLSWLRRNKVTEEAAEPDFVAGEGARVYSLEAYRRSRKSPKPKPTQAA